LVAHAPFPGLFVWFIKLLGVSFPELIFWLILQIWLGGAPNQTRLAEAFMDRVKLEKMESVLEPLFYLWKTERLEKEGFGDFVFRQVPVSHIYFWLAKR